MSTPACPHGCTSAVIQVDCPVHFIHKLDFGVPASSPPPDCACWDAHEDEESGHCECCANHHARPTASPPPEPRCAKCADYRQQVAAKNRALADSAAMQDAVQVIVHKYESATSRSSFEKARLRVAREVANECLAAVLASRRKP